MLLRIEGLGVRIGGHQVLQKIDLEVQQGQIVVVVGPNGSGKSTLMRTIAGLHTQTDGSIQFDGLPLDDLPAHQRVSKGICLIQEGRQLFGDMSVIENLEMGAYRYRKEKDRVRKNIQIVFELFPSISAERERLAKTFSGGEQQMISIGRGLMGEPKMLMIDELSLGLAPKVIGRLFATVKQLNGSGLSILMVEQNVRQALKIAHRVYVLSNGRNVASGSPDQLLNDDQMVEKYLGY